jgi:hypothetical protein
MKASRNAGLFLYYKTGVSDQYIVKRRRATHQKDVDSHRQHNDVHWYQGDSRHHCGLHFLEFWLNAWVLAQVFRNPGDVGRRKGDGRSWRFRRGRLDKSRLEYCYRSAGLCVEPFSLVRSRSHAVSSCLAVSIVVPQQA